ncbi:MAG: hypothetical protein WC284_12585 [Candidimonas sp.]
MKDELFSELKEKYPEVFEHCNYVSIDDGWFFIIDELCRFLSYEKFNLLDKKKYMLTRNPDTNEIIEIEKQIEEESNKIPRATQVKEKFGSLRFYVNKATDEQRNYISFAEAISGHICEKCGNKGKSYHVRWVKTLCPDHARERYGDDANEA